MDMRFLEFCKGSFDGIWASFSLLHIRKTEINKILSGFKSALRDGGLLFAALHPGPQTAWVKTRIAGMERDTYVQEWTQTDIEKVLLEPGFKMIVSRAFERKGARYPLLSIPVHI
jgi:hypothetical protein